MSRFSIFDTPLAGLKLVQAERRGDERGFLVRQFCAEELADAGWRKPIAQINRTFTVERGTVRGMHFQHPPHAEMKLVTCLRGEVWDVAVDLRATSPTFLQWHGERLSEDDERALLIPEGFAHGFQTMADGSELLYLHSEAYAPRAEGGLRPTDTRLAIGWPLPITTLSPRDAGHPPLTDDFQGVRL